MRIAFSSLVALFWLLPACQVRLPVTRWTGDANSEGAGSVDGKPITVDTQPVTVPGLAVLTDTNRDGVVDGRDLQDFLDWSWQGAGAFLLPNLDDDDRKGAVDTSDLIVNGSNDEEDLAPIVIQLDQDMLAKTIDVMVTVTSGQERTHLFHKTSNGWELASGTLSERSARIVLGIEALQFADVDWDGFVVVKVDALGPRQSSLASAQVKMRVAPWLALPNSAKTERLYVSSTTSRLRPDLNKVLSSAGLPDALASSPPGQDLWFQDTMEVGYAQLPGKPPMHVALNARRFNTTDSLAATLLAPDFGFVSVGQPRVPASQLDYWMDWMGNIEVTHPLPGFPLGRILYGTSQRTTFYPDILSFFTAQEVQKPLAVSVDWLPLQLVDELVTFVPGKKGEAKMLVASLTAAQTVTGASLDSFKQQMQRGLDDVTSALQSQLGLSDEDVIPLPASFGGIGADYSLVWSDPVDAVYLNGTLAVGATGTPANVKADIEKRLSAIGVRVAWVDDSEYAGWLGYVRSATNTSRTPMCAKFTDCLP